MPPKKTEENPPVTWRDEVAGVSTPADSGVQSYPTLQFLNGQQSMKGHWREFGMFFIPDAENVGSSWNTTEFLTRNGDSVPGVARAEIEVSVIRLRRAWFVKDSEKQIRRIPWANYGAAKNIGKPRGKCQILMSVTGVNELVCLSLTGMQSAYAMQRDGWGGMARKRLYDPTARILHMGKKGGIERLPALQFRIHIGAEQSNGKPVYTPVGRDGDESAVTRIVLLAPIATVESDADVARYIVPRVIRESYETAYSEADEWAHAWDGAPEPEDNGGYGNIADELD